jgi:aspartyl protease family protein
MALALAAALAAAPAAALSLQLIEIGPDRVTVVLEGTEVRELRIGQAGPGGLRLRSVSGDAATLESGAGLITLRLGQSTAPEVAIEQDASGHFRLEALVNGRAVRALIDTGATLVSVPMQLAEGLGIDWRAAPRVGTFTANGPARAWRVTLARLEIGGIVLTEVPALVSPAGGLDEVLIGMSALDRLEMHRSGSAMRLRLRP